MNGTYCPKCGKLNQDKEARFCAYCGAALTQLVAPGPGATSTQSFWSRNKKWVVVGAVVVVVAAGVTAGVLLTGDSESKSTPNASAQTSTTKRTLPPVQQPKTVTMNDAQAAGIIVAQSEHLAPGFQMLRSVIDRYPNWNQTDQSTFDTMTSSLATEVSFQETVRIPTLSPPVESSFHFRSDWFDGLAIYEKAVSMIQMALASRDADAWERAINLLDEAEELLLQAAVSAQTVDDYAHAGNLETSNHGTTTSRSATTPMPQPTTTTASTATAPSEATLDLRPAGDAFAPAAKTMEIGDSFRVRTAHPNRGGGYIDDDFTLSSLDSSVVSVSEATVTAVGEGHTQVLLHLYWDTVPIYVEVLENLDDADFGPRWDGPGFTDGRVLVKAWVGQMPREPDQQMIIVTMANRSNQDVFLSRDMFDFRLPSEGGYVTCPIDDVEFGLSELGDDHTKSEWTLKPMEMLHAVFYFRAPAKGTVDELLLGFDDGESYIRFVVRDFETSPLTPW